MKINDLEVFLASLFSNLHDSHTNSSYINVQIFLELLF